MRIIARKANEIVTVSIGLYAEMARSAFQLVPRRRTRTPLRFAQSAPPLAT